MNSSVGQSSEEHLSAARVRIEFMRKTRDQGNITEIEPAIIRELMCYLIPLTDFNQTADALENLCVGAILAHDNGEYLKYSTYLKDIIRIGNDL